MYQFPENDDELPLSKFESMLKTNSVFFFDAAEFEEIILHYMNVGKMSLAKKALELGLKQHPLSIELKLVRVEILLYEDNLDEAAKLLYDLETLEPLNDQVYIHKATYFSKKDMHQEAITALKTALIYTDDEVDVLSQIGMEYLFLEDFETARLNFARCLEVEYDDYSSLYNIIYCFDMLGQHHEAIEYLNTYINENPYCEIAWHQIGRQYYLIENYTDALRSFDYSILIDEHFIGAYLEKAKTLEELQRYQEAIDNYMITIDLEEGNSFSYLRIGSCYEQMGNEKAALKYYNITVKEDPLLDKGWLALTNLYVKNKNYQKALYFINKAIQIDEQNPVYWSRYAEINLKLNLFEEAARGFRKCIELEDYALDIFTALVDILHFLGDHQDAVEVLLNARKLYKDFAEIEYRLAGLYLEMNHLKRGLHYLKSALNADADYLKVFADLYPLARKRPEVVAFIEKFNSK